MKPVFTDPAVDSYVQKCTQIEDNIYTLVFKNVAISEIYIICMIYISDI